MFQERITQGADFADVLDILDKDGSVPTYYLGTDELTCNLWQGQNEAPLFSPTVSWSDYATGKVNFAISAAQSATLDANGTYRCQIFATRSGVKPCIADFLVLVSPSAGAGTQTVTTYCAYHDMLAAGEWIEGVQDVDVDQEGFYSQRLLARNWMDWLGINNFRGAFIGNFGAHSTAAFGFGYVGYSRSVGPSPTIIGYFASNFLIVRPQIIKACAHFAVAEVGLAQLGKNSTFFQYGLYHRDMATKYATGIVIELDLNGDGIGEIMVPLGSTNPLQV